MSRRELNRNGSQRPLLRWRARGGFVRPAERVGFVATTATVQSLYCFTSQSPLGSRGVFVGKNVYGGPFAPDPWELYSAGQLDTPSMLILGDVGVGKSALAKCYLLRQRVFGRRAEIVDRKSEYGPIVEAMGGATVVMRPGVTVNPIERHGTREGRESMLRAVARILLNRPMSPGERVGLSAALRAADERHTERDVTIRDVVDELREPTDALAHDLMVTRQEAATELRDCALALQELSIGPLAGMFDGSTSLGADVWDKPAISIDISKLAQSLHAEDESTALAISLVATTAFLDARRLARGGRTVRLLDESWRALAIPGAAAYYQSSLKLARATGVQTVLCLHRLSDLASVGDAGSRQQALALGLLSEMSTKVVYRQASNEAAATRAALDLTSAEGELLTSLSTGEALWRVGDRGFLVRHQIAAAEWPLVQTDEAMGGREAQGVG